MNRARRLARPAWHQKALGQNFLTHAPTIDAIVGHFLSLPPAARWIEIGPGQGALTQHLVAALPERTELLLVERDRGLAAELRAEFESAPPALGPSTPPRSVRVIEADFLELATDRWRASSGERVAVIANLPYSVATAITERLCQVPEAIAHLTLMYQLEVADRLCAGPGDDAWGSLSAWVNNRWSTRRILKVPPSAFRPAPKIWSAVVCLEPRAELLIPETAGDPELWQRLLRVAFRSRRKMLRSVFAGQIEWQNALTHSRVDETKRAEALQWHEWRQLFLSAQHTVSPSPSSPVRTSGNDSPV